MLIYVSITSMHAKMLVYNLFHDKLQSMCIILRVCAISTHLVLLVSNGAAKMSITDSYTLTLLILYC